MAQRDITTLLYILDHIQEGVFVFDPFTLKIIYLNKVALDSIGYSQQEVRDTDPRTYTSISPDSAFWENCYANVEQQGHSVLQLDLKRKNGQIFPAEISLNLVESGGKKYIVGLGRDLSKSNEEKAQLKMSEKSYRDLFDNSRDLIYIHSADMTMIDVNQAVLDRYGMTKDEIIGKGPEVFSAPGMNDISLVRQYIEAAWRGVPQQFNWYSITKSGEIFPKELILRTGWYFGQKVIVATGRDISEQVERNRELQIYQQMFGNMQVGAFVIRMSNPLDIDSLHIIDVNKSAEYHLKSPVEKIIGKPISQVDFLNREEIKNLLIKTIQSNTLGTIQEFEFQAIIGGETSIWCINTFPLQDYSAGIFFEDITNAVRDKNKIIESAILLKEAQLIAGLGVIDLTFDPHFSADISDNFKELVGMGFTDIARITIKDILHLVHPDERKRMLLQCYRAMKKGNYFRSTLRVVNQETGKEIHIQFSARVKGSLNGNYISRLQATIIDITELKTLENMLQERNEELKTFVFRASHDLKGPVSSIRGLVNLAKENRNDREKISRFIELMDTSISKLNLVLNELVQVAYVKEGTIALTSVLLDDFVQTIFNDYQTHDDFENIIITIDISKKLKIETDPILLESILRNLIENAAKYTDANKDAKHITINGKKAAGGVFIRVEDNGIGIPIASQARIFEMFFRATTQSTGTGLGLYIVRNAIDKLGGEIAIDQDYQNGCAFNIYLPAQAES